MKIGKSAFSEVPNSLKAMTSLGEDIFGANVKDILENNPATEISEKLKGVDNITERFEGFGIQTHSYYI